MYFTGSAGGDYDVAPYDAMPTELTGLANVVAASAELKHGVEARDILDLGCGFGRQLAEAGAVAPGRLVGVDASRVTCEGARKVLEPLGERAEIVQADFRDLGQTDLGRFDVIYCVGTLYTVPADVRAILLRTIARSLRPGGVAVMTYYTGTKGYIKAAVAGYLRSLQTPGLMMSDALDKAREQLVALDNFQLPSPVVGVADAARTLARADNIVLAHEAFGHGIEVLSTAVLAAELAPSNISFLGYLGYGAQAFDCGESERLYRAETFDLLEGGYRYALFARPSG